MNHASIRIPTSPRIARDVLNVLNQECPSVKELANASKNDLGMATSILRLANSAAMGRNVPTCDLTTAISRIGLTNLREICITQMKNEAFPNSGLLKILDWNAIWAQSSLAGHVSIALAQQTCEPKRISNIHIGSLFQDIGYFALGQTEQSYLRNLLSLCDKKKTNLADLEDELGFHLHESLSQQILSEWNFPISTASIVRYHESSRRQALPSLSSDTLKSVICVSTACQLARQLQKPIPYFPSATPVPDSHWRILNISKEHAEKLAKESLETFRATHHVLNP